MMRQAAEKREQNEKDKKGKKGGWMCGYNMRSKSTKSKKDRGFYVVPIKIGFANNMCN